MDEEKKLEIDDPIAETRIRVKTTSGIKYAYFIDICHIEPCEKLKSGDSGTSIVAEEDNLFWYINSNIQGLERVLFLSVKGEKLNY